MNKQIALAYGIAGLAVAVALITVIDTNTGLFGRSDGQAAVTPAPEQTVEAVQVEPAANVSSTMNADEALEPPVEVVYVDEPASARRGERERYEDDDDEWEEHERHEHREYGDDDD